mgnify:CR=1 FL=1
MWNVSPLRTALCVSLILLLGFALQITLAQDEPAAKKPTTAECLGCHDGTAAELSPEDRAGMVEALPAGWQAQGKKADPKRAGVSLTVDTTAMKKSVHGDDCSMCHNVAATPHMAKLPPVDCTTCHDEYASLYREGAHFAAVQAGNAKAPVCADCHGGHLVLASSNPESAIAREKVSHQCGSCHTAEVVPGRRGIGAYDNWLESVHAGKKDGQRTNAVCTDCHDSHSARFADSGTANANVARTCGRCHKQEGEDYQRGIHGAALKQGNLSSPTCTDCHGVHSVQAVATEGSSVYGYAAVGNVCGQCHQAERINNRFGIRGTFESYMDSFHGLALKKGDLRSANCASCHGAHLILNSADPASSVNAGNLQETCGKCHPGIGAGVAQGRVHPEIAQDAPSLGEKVQWWVKFIYLGLIPGVLGFMFLHNLIDWLKKVRKHLRLKRLEGRYLRLTRSERIQHIVLMLSFSTLVLSGFALVFGWKIPGISGELNESIRAYTHRIAALAMIGWAVFHCYWAAFTKRGRGYIMAMIPRYKDAVDLVEMIAYNLGFISDKPKFDRFNYIEKMEYLAMIWGTFVMVLTGLILWFEEIALKLMPLWMVDVANIVHYMEAILATLAIIIWHFYSVLFNPDVKPMATHWITGMLSEEEMEHEHPLELERIKHGEPPEA